MYPYTALVRLETECPNSLYSHFLGTYDNNLSLGGVPVLQYLVHGDVDLKFDIPFQWNIDELSTFVAGWLISDSNAPKASMVGIMSSASLLAVLSDAIGPELARAFQTLIYRASLIFNSLDISRDVLEDSHDVKVIRYCGQQLLLYLDAHLRPGALSRLNKHHLYAVFLLLLGTVISSKYFAETVGNEVSDRHGNL